MVLVSGQYRDPDQGEPAMHHCAPDALQVPLIAGPEDHQQGDVQRWRLIERLVKAGEDVKQPSKHAIQFGSGESETQRPDQKATDGNHLRG
ncbi:hypothetical protein D3C86_1539110 [compost metagenome]